MSLHLAEDSLDVLSVVCHWSTYKGTHCRRTKDNKIGLCSLHQELMIDYEYIRNPEEPCEVYSDVKIVPRSYKHLRTIMNSLKVVGNQVDVCIKGNTGGLAEEADITNEDYIRIVSDSSKYYYNPVSRTDLRAKDLKVVLRKYCPEEAVVHARGLLYCEACYKKLPNRPLLGKN